MSKYHYNSKSIHGATLLEIMVSVFIMAFGIMALMLAQIKSVGSVREAEMQTRVAQAVQNLSEGMLGNADPRTRRDENITFAQYNTTSPPVSTVCQTAALQEVCGTSPSSDSSTELVQCHQRVFRSELACALPNAKSISYQISSANHQTTIQVDWTESSGTGNDADEFNFTYRAVVGGQ